MMNTINSEEEIINVYGEIEYDLEMLQNYFNTMDQVFDEELERNIANTNYENLPPIDHGLLDMATELWWEDARQYFLLSFLMLVISKFETHIKRICEIVKNQHDQEISIENFSEGTVRSPRIFLNNIGSFKKPTEALWDEVDQINFIRNICTHKGFDFDNIESDRKKNKIINIQNKNLGILIAEENRIIIIQWQFGNYSIETLRRFFDELKTKHLKRIHGTLLLKGIHDTLIDNDKVVAKKGKRIVGK